MNLYEKINKVMEEVAYLKKDDTIKAGNSSYRAISEEKVTSAIRQSLINNKIVIFPIEQKKEEIITQYSDKYGDKIRLMTLVDVKYRIVNSEKPQEFIEVVSSGSGVDTQDKGIGKAMTYAYKYMLLRTFAIPTGNDPDKIHNNILDEEQTIIIKKETVKLDDFVDTKITQAQQGKIFYTIKEKGVDSNKFKKYYTKKYSVISFNDMTKNEATELIKIVAKEGFNDYIEKNYPEEEKK